MSKKRGNPTRDEKLQNLMFNYSMLLMSTFEGAFATLATGMSEALVEGTNAMTDALSAGLGTPDGPKPKKVAKKDVSSQVSKGVAKMFSEMRKNMVSNMPLDDPSFKEYIKNPEFDKGIRTVESHDFNLPKLTEQLSDDDLASYLALLKAENLEFARMLKDLGEWQQSVPRFGK